MPAIRDPLEPPALTKTSLVSQVDGMRIWHDQTLIKAPWGMPTAIHIDNPNWSYTSAGALSLWVALDDVSERNGCAWT
jgi:phytanoyl-CoA hydroxylase